MFDYEEFLGVICEYCGGDSLFTLSECNKEIRVFIVRKYGKEIADHKYEVVKQKYESLILKA